MGNKDFRQYLCLKCMKFWFVGELSTKRVNDGGFRTIPLSVCPKCRTFSVHYCGTHKDRGSRRLFGERIAHLEYIERKIERIKL